MTEQRLIDATEFDKILEEAEIEAQKHRKYVYASALNGIRGNLKNAPTIEERKNGTWVKISPSGIYECSVCGQNVMTQDIDAYLYCHGCGADMRGEGNGTG